jgi:hypothetical protein
MGKDKVSEHFYRLGMTADMQRRINKWCSENADEETGKPPSFAEGCRELIRRGLEGQSKNPVQTGGANGKSK